MKIIQINALYGDKSTGIIVRDIDDLIRDNQEDSYVFCMRANGFREEVFGIGSPFDWKLHALLTRLTGKQGYGSVISTKKLIRRLNELAPDILHLHNLHSNYINLPMLLHYCAQQQMAVVLTLHDCWFYTGKCFHFQDINCEKWKTHCENCPKNKMDIPSLFKDSSSSAFDDRKMLFSSIKQLHVVGCSNWMTENAKKSPIFGGAQFHTIYNGVDTLIFHGEQVEKDSMARERFQIMVMANKWFLPGNKPMREQLSQKLEKTDTIFIVGCSEDQLKEHTEDNRIQKVGYVRNREELAKLYRASDVFLNLTFIDTLPTVNMESICCGTPVITYRSGGSPELIEEGVTGYVVEPLDIIGMVQAITLVRSGALDREKCSKIGQQQFDKEKNYQKYFMLYQQIMEKQE